MKFNLLWAFNATALGIGYSLIQSGLFMDLSVFGLKYDSGYFVGAAIIPVTTLFLIGGAVGGKSSHRKWNEASSIYWVCILAGSVLFSYLSK